MRKPKTQISFAVTAKLISAFVFATRIVQPLYFLNLKFQVSSHLQWLYSPVCVGPDRKPRRPVFSKRGLFSIIMSHYVIKPTICASNSGITPSAWAFTRCEMSLVLRKPVFGVLDQVRYKPSCTATEDV